MKVIKFWWTLLPFLCFRVIKMNSKVRKWESGFIFSCYFSSKPINN